MSEKEYIEREPIIQFIEHGLNEKKFGYDAIEILGEINFAPAADVASVKHGEWTTIDGISRCSECGYIPLYDNAIDDLFYSDYCPNCGAKMDGDTDANSNDNKTPET